MELRPVNLGYEDGSLACVRRTWDEKSYCTYTAGMNGKILVLVGRGDQICSANYLEWSELEDDVQLALHRHAAERERLIELVSFVIKDRSEDTKDTDLASLYS